jgi:hypothetical protein
LYNEIETIKKEIAKEDKSQDISEENLDPIANGSAAESRKSGSQVEGVSIDNGLELPEGSTLLPVALAEFLRFLEDEFSPIEKIIRALVSRNSIQFEYLWRLFPVGSVVTFKDPHSGLDCAGQVLHSKFSFLI